MEKGKADRGPGITARLWDSSLIQNSASESLQIGQRSEMKGTITMKKLMIATAAAFCATVGLAIESANIVGYSAISNEGNKNPGVGSVFMPITEGETYKLNTIVAEAEDEDDFLVPGAEYLQALNPNGSAVIARYTYVSEAFLKDEFEDEWEDYKGAIGWWHWSKNISSSIEDKDYSNMCGDTDIDVGTAFLGALSSSGRRFTSSGSVPQTATSFSNDGNKNPFFLNYLPVEIDLNDLTITGEDDDFLVPGAEYLQVLNPNGSAVIARYTYVSEAFLQDEFEDEWENYKGAIGWWNWSKNIASLIEDGDYENKISVDKVKLAPGFTFLGALSSSVRIINFPAATK